MCQSLCGKAHLLRRLRVRAGFGSAIANRLLSPFEFRAAEPRGETEEWRSLEQLEAVVEFYANFRPPFPRPLPPDFFGDPWVANAAPLDDSDPDYIRVNLGDIAGTKAKVGAAPNVIQVDDDADLSGIIVNPANNPAVGPAPPAGSPLPQRHEYLYDTLWLKEDNKRPSKLYRITAVDDVAKTITLHLLEGTPDLQGKTSNWHVNRRPIIVVVDPLGARSISATGGANALTVWKGDVATIVGPAPGNPSQTVLQLDMALPFDRINKRQDTIYLKSDSATHVPASTYRIVDVAAPPNRQITIAGTPSIGAGSAWHIPAGLSGQLSGSDPDVAGRRFKYNLNPPNNPPERGTRGHDHYDADLFIVHRGTVRARFRFTSFTSRDYGSWREPNVHDWRQELSSIRGNGLYYYAGYRSEEGYKNYSFAIVDATPTQQGLSHNRIDINDHVLRARFYSGTPNPPATVADGAQNNVISERVMSDQGANPPAGKGAIRFHRGNVTGSNTGSAGCVVSPIYYEMRNELIRIYEEECREFYGAAGIDAHIHQILAQTAIPSTTVANIFNANNAAEALYGANTPTDPQWVNKLVGAFWLVRPDEVPLS
jgi:hypothetical protein